MTWIADETKRAEKIKAKRDSWTPAQIQANLDRAEERYNNYPCSSHAYDKRSAQDKVDATPVLVWVHAYGAWARLNEEFQAVLKDIRENDGEWDCELEESRYQAKEATKLAYVDVEAQKCTAQLDRFSARLAPVAPLNMCAELRAEWSAGGGI